LGVDGVRCPFARHSGAKSATEALLEYGLPRGGAGNFILNAQDIANVAGVRIAHNAFGR